MKKIEIDGMCIRSLDEEKALAAAEEKAPEKGKGGKGGPAAKGKKK